MKIFLICALTLFFAASSRMALASELPWKTIKTKYGFSVSYPSEWEVLDPEGERDPATLPFFRMEGPVSERKKDKDWVQMDMGCLPHKRSGPEKGPKESARDFMVTPQVTRLGERELTLGGEPAYEVTGFDSSFVDPKALVGRGGIYKYLAAWHHHQLCTVTYAEMGADTKKMTSDREWKYQDIVEKILSSFKFTR